MNTIIANNAHRPVDAPPETTSAALRRLDPLRPLRNALRALGIDHVVSIVSIDASTAELAEPVAFNLAWSLPNSGQAHVAWTASVSATSDDSSLLSVSVRASTNNPEAEHELLCAWPVIGQIIDSQTTRLLRAVTELADTLAENNLLVPPNPHRLLSHADTSDPTDPRSHVATTAGLEA